MDPRTEVYLGFDFSTQQLKVVAVDENCEVICECSVHFDTELPEFKTEGGVHRHEDGLTVTTPTLLWVKALDLALQKLRSSGLNFSNVVSLSGSAQQHGSVYWKDGAHLLLAGATPGVPLDKCLQDCFSICDSPVWMDSSTSSQCQTLETSVGGPLSLAAITGSRAYERFTGNQIAKMFQTQPDVYYKTEKISLISSFAASLFLGKYAPIDLSDGSGMNILDIHTKDWSDICLEACAPGLKERLGKPVPSTTILGKISNYFVKHYGFNPDCKIVAFTGDNPSSLAGLKLKKGDIAVSLGTSDTAFLWLSHPKPSVEGHVLCNPLARDEYMALLCFKNGSLTRERIRDECARGSWEIFNKMLEQTPRGNCGNIGLYFDVMEIIPPVVGIYRFNENDDKVENFSDKVEIRAVIEGHFLSMRMHAENVGYSLEKSSCIIATGGASVNKKILQVLSDVFNLPVYVYKTANSACLGAAYRSKHGLSSKTAFNLLFQDDTTLQLAVLPSEDSNKVYSPMIDRLRDLEEKLMKTF